MSYLLGRFSRHPNAALPVMTKLRRAGVRIVPEQIPAFLLGNGVYCNVRQEILPLLLEMGLPADFRMKGDT